jgi:post-segregation antitoxin (ccd killing protein)
MKFESEKVISNIYINGALPHRAKEMGLNMQKLVKKP